MSGSVTTRNNIVQIHRTPTPNNPPPPQELMDGELAVEQSDPMKLWVGVPTGVDPSGRKLLFDRGALAQLVVNHDASLFGNGQVPTPLGVAQATQALLAGLRVATTPEIAAGATPLDTVAITPAGLRTETGLPAAQLSTTAKQIVPAINEIITEIAAVLGVLVFAGAYNAATGVGQYNGHGGIAAGSGPLPAASAGNNNAFLIVVADGPGSGVNEPAAPLHIEDWLVSDGAAWIQLHLHTTTALASNIGVVPPVPPPGGTNVQVALEQIWAVASTAIQALFFASPTFVGDALTAGTALDVNVLDAGTY